VAIGQAPERTPQRHGSAETAISVSRLPAEMLDHVVDHLYDTEDALRNCCLVSKSWIPRTRKHLSTITDSPPQSACNHGGRRFRILQPLLRFAPSLCSSITLGWSRLQMRKRVAGSEVFLASCNWRWALTKLNQTLTSQRPLSFHSTDSRPPLNPSAWLLLPFPPHRFSTLSLPSLFSGTLAVIICSETSADDCGVPKITRYR
jgi:hypothetical protein